MIALVAAQRRLQVEFVSVAGQLMIAEPLTLETRRTILPRASTAR
jgi:hypothetical protein